MTRSGTSASPPRGVGAWLDGVPLAPRATDPPYASQRYFGSGALEWCWLAAGRYPVYLHGWHKIWDYAAGCLILAEADGATETLTGEAVFAADLSARSVLAAADPALLREWRMAPAGKLPGPDR